jgi:hypothetical protein
MDDLTRGSYTPVEGAAQVLDAISVFCHRQSLQVSTPLSARGGWPERIHIPPAVRLSGGPPLCQATPLTPLLALTALAAHFPAVLLTSGRRGPSAPASAPNSGEPGLDTGRHAAGARKTPGEDVTRPRINDRERQEAEPRGQAERSVVQSTRTGVLVPWLHSINGL